MSEPDHANIRVAPALLMGWHIVLGFILGWVVPIRLPGWFGLVGWLFLLGGLGLGFGALSALRRAQTTPATNLPTTRIVSEGIYRFSRNPIYLGFVCIGASLPLVFGSLWGVLLVPFAMFAIQWWVIDCEEAYLKRKFDQAYLDYQSQVRRWF